MRNLLDKGIDKIRSTIHILGGTMSIKTHKHSYYPGETIAATIELKLKQPVTARAITAEFFCIEQWQVKKTREMDTYDYRLERELGIERSTNLRTQVHEERKILFKQAKEVAGSGEYKDAVFEVQFKLPEDAPATSYELGHDNKTHLWKLAVKLDIPSTFDKNAEIEVLVRGLSV
jgi:hypothetical protein